MCTCKQTTSGADLQTSKSIVFGFIWTNNESSWLDDHDQVPLISDLYVKGFSLRLAKFI